MLNLGRALDDGGLGILDLKAFLQGALDLTRVMTDRRAHQSGRLEGEAVFVPDGKELVYRERGVVRLGAYEGPVTRVYRYAFSAPGRAEIAFEVEGQDLWTVVWRVLGPRKDQVLTSRHARSA